MFGHLPVSFWYWILFANIGLYATFYGGFNNESVLTQIAVKVMEKFLIKTFNILY